MDHREHFYYVCVATALAVCTGFANSERTFVKSVTHDGYSCPSTFDFGTAVSAIACSAECDRKPLCNSFSYNAILKFCRGNFNVFTDTISCLTYAGGFYYKAGDVQLGTPCMTGADCPLQYSVCVSNTCVCNVDSQPSPDGTQCNLLSTYSITCNSHVDCVDPHTECWDEKCKCKPGYSHIPGTSQCTENCTNYGSDYIKYVGMDLNCQSDYHSALDPVACMDICTGLPTCLSMSYHNGLGACQVRFCDPMTHPGAFVSLAIVDTYVRNCAAP